MVSDAPDTASIVYSTVYSIVYIIIVYSVKRGFERNWIGDQGRRGRQRGPEWHDRDQTRIAPYLPIAYHPHWLQLMLYMRGHEKP